MKMKCDRCQAEMIDKSKVPYIDYICPICGNEIVTYDYEKNDPIKFDEQNYEISILDKDLSIDNLKNVSKLSVLNIL